MASDGSMSSKGASAGNSFSDAVKGAFHGADDLRKGINNFADNAIQPSAARDAERGVTSQHKVGTDVHAPDAAGHTAPGPAMGTGTAGFKSGGTHSSSGGSGFSNDGKGLGNSLKSAMNNKDV